MTAARLLPALASLLAAVALTGCGIGTVSPSSPGSMNVTMNGKVFGGQQPVAGAHVHVFQASFPSGTLNPIPSGSSTSIDLIQNNPQSGVTAQDSLGYYVQTDASGNFSITGTYACANTAPVYLLATQGNPGLGPNGNNPNLALLVVLADSCVSGGMLSPALHVIMNELTTVAGVYALSGYLTAPNILQYYGNSTGAAAVPPGLLNAADTAMALVTPSQGAVNATMPSGGTIPAATITTLANVLASCVNSPGVSASGSMCSTLFNNATSNGTSSGSVPSDTVTAMLNIAHNPSANVGALYALATPAAPFSGGLTTPPHDWALVVGYQPILASASQLSSPSIPAVDANGNIWFASTKSSAAAGYTVMELSPLGAALSSAVVPFQPAQVAIGVQGSAWIAQRSGGIISEVTSASAIPTNFAYNGISNDDGHQIATDANGYVYLDDFTNGNAYQLRRDGTLSGVATLKYPASALSLSFYGQDFLVYGTNGAIAIESDAMTGYDRSQSFCGSYTVGCTGGGLYQPTAMAMSVSGVLWALNSNSTLSAFVPSTTQGTPASLQGSPFAGGGLNTITRSASQPTPWLTIDGSQHIWVANYTGSLSEFDYAGTAITPAANASTSEIGGLYGSTPSCNGQGLAIDGSGNIWVSCDSTTVPVLEFIGAASPLITPLIPQNFASHP